MKIKLMAMALIMIAAKPILAQKQGAALWYSKATVTRVKKENRLVAGPLPSRQQTSLLTIQWRLVMRGDGNVKMEVNPDKVFATGDQLQLAITANQDGYLYIIHYMEGQPGQLLFPNPFINGGQNFVKKNKEYFVPSRCSNIQKEDDCWLTMAPPAGTENLIIIFSRDRITTLPNEITSQTGFATIKPEIIEDLRTKSSQTVREVRPLSVPGLTPSQYGKWVQNINRRDNEELITSVKLKHVG
jgi:hypothetical protein